MKQKPKVTPMATHCGHCGKPLAEGRHWKTKYCCPSHRVMASTGRAAVELKRSLELNGELLAALEGFIAIAADSEGVSGYHLNGDVAYWGEFEEIEMARAAIAKAKGEAA